MLQVGGQEKRSVPRWCPAWAMNSERTQICNCWGLEDSGCQCLPGTWRGQETSAWKVSVELPATEMKSWGGRAEPRTKVEKLEQKIWTGRQGYWAQHCGCWVLTVMLSSRTPNFAPRGFILEPNHKLIKVSRVIDMTWTFIRWQVELKANVHCKQRSKHES